MSKKNDNINLDFVNYVDALCGAKLRLIAWRDVEAKSKAFVESMKAFEAAIKDFGHHEEDQQQ